MILQNDPFLNAMLNRFAAPTSVAPANIAPMDAYRRGSDVWVHLDLPGVAADSLDISIERNVLTVTGERGWERQAGDQVYLSDRSQGRYHRQVHLGEGLDTDGIEADHHDGVLTLRIPVSEKAKPRKITVRAGEPMVVDEVGEVSESVESVEVPAAG